MKSGEKILRYWGSKWRFGPIFKMTGSAARSSDGPVSMAEKLHVHYNCSLRLESFFTLNGTIRLSFVPFKDINCEVVDCRLLWRYW